MFLKAKDRLLIGVILVFTLIISFLLWSIFGVIIILIVLVVMLGIILTFQLESYRRIEVYFKEQEEDREKRYRQTEAMFNLFSTLNINRSLPPLREFAVFPDFANVLVSTIKEHKPKRILEIGCGVSTIISAIVLKEIGSGSITSIEHDKHYAKITRKNLKAHNVDDIVKVIHAPLKRIQFGNRSWQWYDKIKLKNIKDIDMLVIDGPPAEMQKLSRYPALPVLFKSLKPDSLILMDDAKRKDERKIIKLWLKQYKGLSYDLIDTQKGAGILKKRDS